MRIQEIPERTAAFVEDGPPPDPIPAHDAWVCEECDHEIAV